jgi:hypothetical protein
MTYTTLSPTSCSYRLEQIRSMHPQHVHDNLQHLVLLLHCIPMYNTVCVYKYGAVGYSPTYSSCTVKEDIVTISTCQEGNCNQFCYSTIAYTTNHCLKITILIQFQNISIQPYTPLPFN